MKHHTLSLTFATLTLAVASATAQTLVLDDFTFAPVKQKAASTRVSAPAETCASLTTAALQAVIDKMIESCNAAQLDEAANGVNGAYASAARDNVTYLKLNQTSRESDTQAAAEAEWAARFARACVTSTV
jgi:hypothetical protein